MPASKPVARRWYSATSAAQWLFRRGTRTKEAVLQDGDIIRCGGSLFIFRCEPTKVPDAKIDSLIGQSLLSRRLRHEIALFAPTQCTVLLLGESGTGKEVTARGAAHAVRRRGATYRGQLRRDSRNAGRKSALWHVAGVHRGQSPRRLLSRGPSRHPCFSMKSGTSGLASAQASACAGRRVITPVGSVEPQPCKVRLIAATNRHLQSEVADGKLRGDLYARLVEIVLRLPPLRARREDILLFARALLGMDHRCTRRWRKRCCCTAGRGMRELAKSRPS